MNAGENMELSVGAWLRKRDFMLATAESCTGGLVAHLITNVSGSSDYFLGGVVAYHNLAKQVLLGVHEATLQQLGAVSRETALEMARGARRAFSRACPQEKIIGLSTTGIAGPNGAMPGKPVGLVWIGLSAPMIEDAWSFTWNGTREENKGLSAQQALKLLLGCLTDEEIWHDAG
jgi:PncC family amidohydrolase